MLSVREALWGVACARLSDAHDFPPPSRSLEQATGVRIRTPPKFLFLTRATNLKLKHLSLECQIQFGIVNARKLVGNTDKNIYSFCPRLRDKFELIK